MDLVKAARVAGAAGQDWNRWIMSDEVQDTIVAADFGPNEQEAIEQAFTEGRREKLAATGRIMYTTAPKDYDSGSAVELEVVGDFFGKPLRKIVIEPEDYEWQAGRYGSGTYGVWDQDPIAEDRRFQEESAKRVAERAAFEAKREAGIAWLKTATDAELADEDRVVDEHGVKWDDIRAERKRRREVAHEEGRTSEWARIAGLIPEGATLIDDGAYIPAPMVGLRPVQRPARVHYDVRIVHGWPDDAEHAQVHEATGKGSSKPFGTAAHVADMISKGQLRVARPGKVPPRAVVERVGYERWKEIRRVETGGKVVWVGRAVFGSEDLVLDENGRLVRAKKIVEAAKAEAAAAERARISAVASAVKRAEPSEPSVGHAMAAGYRAPRRRMRRRGLRRMRRRGLRARYGGRGGWFGQRGRHSTAARKGWLKRK